MILERKSRKSFQNHFKINSKSLGNHRRRQTKNDNIWPKPMVLGPEPWVCARCGHVWCKPPPKQPKMTPSGPNPGSGPENLGLGQMWSFWVFWFRNHSTPRTKVISEHLLGNSFRKNPKSLRNHSFPRSGMILE